LPLNLGVTYRLQTLEGDDISNSWNVDQLCRFYALSFDYSEGQSLHDYSWATRCKWHFSPGTSLRTTLLQDPTSAATNGSMAAQSTEDSSGGLQDHVL
jgi:hypothetical protein